ncbi:MAG: serine/threonine protein kinase [Candidatus Riflebacteria bacterium]|nr:serine/threonine protein kinase [Candidatus Riflebacteria bacterium]
MIEVGSTFKGYQILEFVGAGGAGQVFKALQPHLQRVVALKVFELCPTTDLRMARRFMHEARILARLSHPNIVRVYDFGEDYQCLYYAMEFAPGSSVDRQLRQGQAYAPAEAARIVGEVLGALEAVHEAGVYHRDLKPANVLKRPSGGVVLSDFGLALQLDATRVTAAGARVGTLPYFAPELTRPGEPDGRCDLYQVGVMFFELLDGVVPYSMAEIVRMIRGGGINPETPLIRITAKHGEAVSGFLRRAMAPEPDARFQTAREMRVALAALKLRADESGASLPSMEALPVQPEAQPRPADAVPDAGSAGSAAALCASVGGTASPATEKPESPPSLPSPGGGGGMPVGDAGSSGRMRPSERRQLGASQRRLLPSRTLYSAAAVTPSTLSFSPGRIALRLAALAALGFVLAAGWSKLGGPRAAVGPPARPAPGRPDAAAAVRPTPVVSAAAQARQSPREEAARVLRERLLRETRLPLWRVQLGPSGDDEMEVALVAAHELLEAELTADPAYWMPAILEVNGKPAGSRSASVLPALLQDGNNRLLLRPRESAGGKRPLLTLRIRRRPGAALRWPTCPAGSTTPIAIPPAAERFMELARAEYRSARYKEALQALERAVAAAPENWRVSQEVAESIHSCVYAFYGVAAGGGTMDLLNPVGDNLETWRLREYEHFNDSLRRRPCFDEAWFDLGRGYQDYLRFADAERSLAMACLLGPRNPSRWWQLARLLADQVPRGREADSQTMQLAVQLSRAAFEGERALDPMWLVERSSLFRRAGLLDAARQDCEVVLQRLPDHKAARSALDALKPASRR